MAGVIEQFRPHPDLKKLYYTYLAISKINLAWILPATAAGFVFLPHNIASIVAACLLAPCLSSTILGWYWIRHYYDSISFTLTDNQIVVCKGIWWKKKSHVPYNRITNINIVQGPISRHFQLGKLLIQTTGLSGSIKCAESRPAEAAIFGIKNFEQTKDKIMSYIMRALLSEVEEE